MRSVLIAGKYTGGELPIRRLFETEGKFTVCGEAESAGEVIAKASKLGPSLIVLDASVPFEDGIKIVQELNQAVPSVPVFMLTSEYTVATERMALAYGVAAVFAKDSDPVTLISNARAVCGEELT